ncbi:endonuclease/exonuclease/phosphatase family metal-dependent hydrolase [Melghirimyces profundicolus]|uniref:Endonuclease/exonuclease/phosphatase family metal-dependent hydrolase n=1 Tax=Melghirimyces profundicolus TaxID=1242148 RepID=A0A2T6BVH9_9BACL|nr:endonuclease/exonuclease/phosphatase family protein [Melghirimyces profundicolus]PTX59987.1 endonuclease/exonuclease/phosphatase family metal-dependent hydrolase [Melghirimyces profundicolus]
MHYFYAPIYNLPPNEDGQPNRQFGVAVLSKFPIIQAENREITRLSTQEPNSSPKPAPGFAEVLLNVRGSKTLFYVTHLDYRSDPSVRKMQVRDMMDIFKENEREKILVGDMNATPQAQELKPLFNSFQDAWSTNGEQNGFTYSALDPVKRIDYIFATPGIQMRTADVIETLASDHLPVVADVTLTRVSNRGDRDE